MVIGNGMLAQAFERYKDDDNIVIFASGVSNSKETDIDKYLREINMLYDASLLKSQSKLIYFSTTSIFDPSLIDSAYIKHKREIEKIIENNFPNYLIFRLPQVIGRTTNPNTFYNHLKNKIVNSETVTIYENASRWIIDVDDVVGILSSVIDDVNQNKKTMNVAFDNKTSVLKLVSLMEILLRKKSDKENALIGGDDYDFDKAEFIFLADKLGMNVTKGYNVITLKKYL